MKVLFTGGGTMGHVSPALAIAEALSKRSIGDECVFVGRKGGKENDAIQKAGYPLYTVEVSGILGKRPIETIRALRQLRYARAEARAILAKEKPDVVVGTGGYVCFPVVSEAARGGIPTLLHESNATPGLTTRVLGRWVDTVMLGISGGQEAFPKGIRTVYTGTPVREAFTGGTHEEAKRKLGLSGRRVVLSFGGSLGAECINRLFLTLCERVCVQKIVWIHATGERYIEEVKSELSKKDCKNSVRIVPFLDDMPTYLKAADAVISRAGAATIAEHEAVGIVPLLIPSPNVTKNHQYHNARRLADREEAILIEESELESEQTLARIVGYLEGKEGRISKKQNRENATQRAIAAIQETLAQAKR